MNAYFTQTMPYNGYAYYPANALYSTRIFLNGTLDTYYLGSGTMPHELGHNFNLIHTFGESSVSTELVTRGAGANCTTAGDLICDTPADPGRDYTGFSTAVQNGCDTYTGTCLDANGATFSPDVTNLMSYYNATACRSRFSNGQYNRIDGGLALRQSHTAYSLTAVSTNVSPVTNLTASLSGGSVVLTWTDNANNEMGYFIERSTTSANTGFLPIGGVAPNILTFTDTKPPSGITAYYRVRPSNSTGNISTVISLITPVCRPSFSMGCGSNDGLKSFVISGTVLSQNTGCSVGSYSQYTAVTPMVTAGQPYSLSGVLLSTVSTDQEGITIWADLNRNGSFSEAGEQLFQTPTTVTSSFSGSLTIPASTSAGLLNIRVLVVYKASPGPGDPCGSYQYGETEDYRLNVVALPTCTVMATTKAGSWNDPTVWSCNRVPVSNDAVSVRHIITVPANAICKALKVSYTASGKVLYNAGGKLNLGISN
jgi:trimeric autotransporter adhesin